LPIPILISELSQTAASNYPAGSDSPATLDDTQRAHASFIAQLRDGKGFTNPVVMASATTTDIGGQNSQFVEVSGTTTITSLGSTYNGPRFLRFTGILTLTHNATTLVIPGAANITTAAGDMCIALPNQTLTGWNISNYSKASGVPLGSAASGANSDITSLSAATSITGLTTPIRQVREIQPISASVAANALTISASALSLEFRSATLTSGAVSFVQGTPANLVISSGSTLGTVNAVRSDIVVIAINNAGTIELAAVNISGGNDLSETGLITTVAEGGAGAADSATVVYSTTARTSVAYRVLGVIRSTQATAGTWVTAPSLIQGSGGQALAAMSSLGYGQTWQNVTGSRALATTYYNTTGKPILVSHYGFSSTANALITLTIGGVAIAQHAQAAGILGSTIAGIVPPGVSYSVANAGASPAFTWSELR